MCVFSGEADASGTQIMLYEADPRFFGGRTVHAMAYQATLDNLARGPNTLMVHLPSVAPMGPENFIPATAFPHILDDMVAALHPVDKSARSLGANQSRGGAVQVFTVGIYTVVLGAAADIAGALSWIALEMRDKLPAIDARLVQFYADAFPYHTMALCLFNASAKAEPLLFWYQPQRPDVFVFPALDEHRGGVPHRGLVMVDHQLIAGSYLMDLNKGARVYYQDQASIPPQVSPLLADRVVGWDGQGRMDNGDFVIPVSAVQQGQFPRPWRVFPGDNF